MTWLISLIHIHWILIYPVGSAIQRLIVIVIACLPTKHVGVHMNSFKWVRAFQIELEFGSVGFWGEGKTGVPGEKPLGAKERTNNKLNPHMASTPGVEPWPHWWEASALTTAPPLLPWILQPGPGSDSLIHHHVFIVFPPPFPHFIA